MRRTKQTCANCRFARPTIDMRSDFNCHRRAPVPHSAFIYHLAELFRDIAWSQHRLAGFEDPKEDDDLNTEATEAHFYASWPEVERDDWCGEWEKK